MFKSFFYFKDTLSSFWFCKNAYTVHSEQFALMIKKHVGKKEPNPKLKFGKLIRYVHTHNALSKMPGNVSNTVFCSFTWQV